MQIHSATQNDVHALLRNACKLGMSKAARERLSWIVFMMDEGMTVDEASAYFSISRSTLLKWIKRFRVDDPQSLEDGSRKPHQVRSSAVSHEVVMRIEAMRKEKPYVSKEEISLALHSEISPATVGRIIAKHGLYFGDSPLHKRRRSEWETLHGSSASPFEDAVRIGSISTYVVRSALATMFIALGSTLPLRAHAEESASFRLYHTIFSGYNSGTPSTSGQFRLNENGVTWHRPPVFGSNFKITDGPPVSSSSSSSTGTSGDSGGDGGDDGGGGGRRCTGDECRPPTSSSSSSAQPPASSSSSASSQSSVAEPPEPDLPDPEDPEPPIYYPGPPEPPFPVPTPIPLFPETGPQDGDSKTCTNEFERYYDPMQKTCMVASGGSMLHGAAPLHALSPILRPIAALLAGGYLLFVFLLKTTSDRLNAFYDFAILQERWKRSVKHKKS